MERSDYHRHVLSELRQLLLGPHGRPKPLGNEGTEERVVVEDVRMENYPAGEIVIVLYRELLRPECLFGWSMETQEAEEKEIWTRIVWANFLEHVIGSTHGLPAECSKEGITWTG